MIGEREGEVIGAENERGKKKEMFGIEDGWGIRKMLKTCMNKGKYISVFLYEARF